MAILTSLILSTLTVTTSITTTKDINDPNTLILNDEDTFKLIEDQVTDIVDSNPMLSDETVLEKSFEAIDEATNHELDDKSLEKAKEKIINDLPLARNAAFTIGTGEMKYLKLGRDPIQDRPVYFLLNHLVSKLYPELKNLSPNSEFTYLPTPNSPQYQNQYLRFKNVLEQRPIALSNVKRYFEIKDQGRNVFILMTIVTIMRLMTLVDLMGIFKQ
ncbi:MAG: hypothetical protein LBR37_03125 [Erysipelotrichaceae bacterium]|jgi:hypothetical protein|nr:hypothetical protein [Erysipelotrichaceae bacterium]